MNEMNTLNSSDSNDFIDLFDLIKSVFKDKILILVTTLITFILFLLISLTLDNKYQSTAIVAPAVETTNPSQSFQALSSIAGYTGLDISSDSNITIEAIERIQSLDFFSDHFLPYINLQDLVASNNWDPLSGKLEYDSSIFNEEKGLWVREVDYPKTVKPSDQEAFKFYEDILSITYDNDTHFVELSIIFISPDIAKEWLDLIIKNINESLREIDRRTALNAISFLESQSKTTNLTELNEAISTLLEDQLKTLMLTSARKDYVFKIISSPVSPEMKSSPNRVLICIIGIFLGFMLGLFISIFKSLFLRHRL